MAEGKTKTIEIIHHHLAQASRILDGSKIWGGQGWVHHDLPVVKKHEAAVHIQAAFDKFLELKDDIQTLEELAGISHGG